MLKAIVITKNPMFWVVLHLLLGLLCAFANFFFILWFAIVALSSLNMLGSGSRDKKLLNVLYFVSYFASMELLGRMCKSYQYKLPWEFGKYVVFFGAIYAILILNARKGTKGFLLFILLIPSMFFGGDRDIIWHDIVFNLLGPISVAFAIIAFSRLKITKQQFRQIVKLLLYPAISVLAYVVIKTPDLDSLEFSLEANFSTTGGYGSNQVSTVLGLGLFLSFLFYVNRWELTGNRLADLAIMLGFAFQGLLSFSRGGMIGGILGIIVFIFMISKSSPKVTRYYQLPKIGKYVLPALIGLVLIFQVADAITGGQLALRYAGETNLSVQGKSEVSINTLTTGRFDILLEDLEVWQDHFVLGAGAGVSQWVRAENSGGMKIASHVEISRLLAEHGLLGLTWIVILVLMGVKLIVFNTNAKYQGILLAFFIIAVYTTFHAATRTYLTPLLIGISLVTITDIKELDAEKS